MSAKSWLQKVDIAQEVRRGDFLKFMAADKKKELLELAKTLKGKRVVHINATAQGGGVAEILKSLIPYLRSLGVQSDWYSINPKTEKKFFNITNKIHNALQGAPVKITAGEWGEYIKVNKSIAEELDGIDCDLLAINDPQPLLAGSYSKAVPKIYFSHIDTSAAHKPVLKKLFPFFAAYRKIIFSNRNFIPAGLSRSKIKVFTPAIDPLAPKQKIIPKKEARGYLKKYGKIPENAPLVVQISRFDIWKNPLGVMQAFRISQSTHPKACLALVGFNEAKDNPAAAVIYNDIGAVAGKSKDIFIFFNPKGKNVLEFTVAAQNAADVVVQNSIKEGFGLTVAEAMWKRQPVIGGPASGIRRQIKNGKNGFIVGTPEELAKKITFLLSNPKKKKVMGEAARSMVLREFLFPRLILDHLRLYASCVKK